ncbi:hypothetical protein P7C70_g7722, partial [Phenoliferia sp. Uapishka_3]
MDPPRTRVKLSKRKPRDPAVLGGGRTTSASVASVSHHSPKVGERSPTRGGKRVPELAGIVTGVPSGGGMRGTESRYGSSKRRKPKDGEDISLPSLYATVTKHNEAIVAQLDTVQHHTDVLHDHAESLDTLENQLDSTNARLAAVERQDLGEAAESADESAIAEVSRLGRLNGQLFERLGKADKRAEHLEEQAAEATAESRSVRMFLNTESAKHKALRAEYENMRKEYEKELERAGLREKELEAELDREKIDKAKETHARRKAVKACAELAKTSSTLERRVDELASEKKWVEQQGEAKAAEMVSNRADLMVRLEKATEEAALAQEDLVRIRAERTQYRAEAQKAKLSLAQLKGRPIIAQSSSVVDDTAQSAQSKSPAISAMALNKGNKKEEIKETAGEKENKRKRSAETGKHNIDEIIRNLM